MSADPRIGVTHNRALCCECGQVRTFSNGHSPRNRISEAVSPHNDAEQHWRWMGDLKCSACRATTRHALLRDCAPESTRSFAERSDYPRVLTPMERLEAAHIRLRRVEDIEEGRIYYRKSKLLLVDVLSTDAEVDHAIDAALKYESKA